MRHVLLAAALALSPSAVAQQVLRPDEARADVSLEALEPVAREVRSYRNLAASPTELVHRRITAACAVPPILASLRQQITQAQSVRVTVDPAARDAWRRITGRTLERDLDARDSVDACLELAARHGCLTRSIRQLRAMRHPAWRVALAAPRVEADFYVDDPLDNRRLDDDTDAGASSVRRYEASKAALSRSPDDLTLRLRVAGMQALAGDPSAALETLRPAPSDDPDVRTTAALARWYAGDAAQRDTLVALAREGHPLAALTAALLPADDDATPTEARRACRVRLSLARVFACGAGPAGQLPRGAMEAARDALYEARTCATSTSWGPGCGLYGPVRPAEAPEVLRTWCPSARDDATRVCERATELLGDALRERQSYTATPAAGPRLVAPAATAVTGLRPVFAWRGDVDARWELCADRGCARVLRAEALRSPAAPTRDLPEGTSYWRVRDRRGVSPTRVLQAHRRVRVTRDVPDLDGDGHADLVLSRHGVYARLRGDAPPELVRLHDGDDAFAETLYVDDWDGDGYGDAAQATREAVWLLRGGPEGLRAPVHLTPHGAARPVTSAWDLDADGAVDLRLGADGGSLLLRSDGTEGTFPPSPFDQAQRLGDFDLDGLTDFAVGHYDIMAGHGAWSIMATTPGHAAGRTLQSFVTRTPFARLVPLGDLDGDGREDHGLFDVEAHPRHALTVLRARGAPQRRALLTDDPRVALLRIGDLDGDGHDDLVVHASGAVTVRHGGPAGLSARTRPVVDGLASDALVVAQPARAAPGGPVWVIVDGPLRAFRVTASAVAAFALRRP